MVTEGERSSYKKCLYFILGRLNLYLAFCLNNSGRAGFVVLFAHESCSVIFKNKRFIFAIGNGRFRRNIQQKRRMC